MLIYMWDDCSLLSLWCYGSFPHSRHSLLSTSQKRSTSLQAKDRQPCALESSWPGDVQSFQWSLASRNAGNQWRKIRETNRSQIGSVSEKIMDNVKWWENHQHHIIPSFVAPGPPSGCLELVPMPGKSSSTPAGVTFGASFGAASNQSMASKVPLRSILGGMVIRWWWSNGCY